MRLSIIGLSLAAFLSLNLSAAEIVAATTKDGVPGGTFASAASIDVKVSAVDAATRVVTLLFPDGKSASIKLGAEAVNFDKIKVNDTVKLAVSDEMVVGMVDAAAVKSDAAAGVVLGAPEGAAPAGAIITTMQVTATVSAIDIEKRTATLQFPDGATKIVKVRPDIDLKARKTGEKVQFTITRTLAMQVAK